MNKALKSIIKSLSKIKKVYQKIFDSKNLKSKLLKKSQLKCINTINNNPKNGIKIDNAIIKGDKVIWSSVKFSPIFSSQTED